MKILTKTLGLLIITFGLFVAVSSASASTTDQLQPASSLVVDKELQVLGTARAYSIRIGAQGYGGVTFFNGTIINETTDADTGAGMPVTFGDDVRIDGELFRTEVGGDNHLKLADTIMPQTTATYDLGTSSNVFRNGYFSGTITTASLTTTALSGTGIVDSGNILDGTIATADLADSSITSAKIVNETITSEDITNSTITGSDISSSADLNVATGTFSGTVTTGALTSSSANFTGNVIQTLTGNGLVKAIIYADDSGTCAVANQYTYTGDSVSCSGTGSGGGITFTLPFNVFGRAAIATPSASHGNTIIPGLSTYQANPDRITVYLYDETGADVDGQITVIIF